MQIDTIEKDDLISFWGLGFGVEGFYLCLTQFSLENERHFPWVWEQIRHLLE